MAVPLVFRVSVLLTCVNDHSAGRRLDYSSCDGINNERGHYLNRDGIIKVARSFLRLSGTPLPLSPSHQTPTLLLHLESLSDNCGEALGLSKPKKKRKERLPALIPPHLPPRWSMGVNQSLALLQIGNEHPRARKNNYDRAAAKMDSCVGSPSLCSSSPGRWGPAMGSNYRWMPADSPVPAARAIGPRPRAFSRQIASSALKSNLLRTAGFYQTNRRFPFVPRDGAVGTGKGGGGSRRWTMKVF